MISLAIVCFWALVGSIVAQSVMTLIFVRALGRWRTPLPADDQCPQAAVVLCLRGRDPFLKSCVQALLAQDYPHYDVRVVVDSRDDPAWQEVEQIAAACRSTNVRIEPLAKRRDTCSLKCSSLAQAVGLNRKEGKAGTARKGFSRSPFAGLSGKASRLGWRIVGRIILRFLGMEFFVAGRTDAAFAAVFAETFAAHRAGFQTVGAIVVAAGGALPQATRAKRVVTARAGG